MSGHYSASWPEFDQAWQVRDDVGQHSVEKIDKCCDVSLQFGAVQKCVILKTNLSLKDVAT